jgi:CubicO group peptidase (beta-lactamase class C family)
MSKTDQPQQVIADTPITLDSGATAIVPKEWFVSTHPDTVVLHDPEKVVTIVLTQRSETEALDAITAAWQNFMPDFARVPEVVVPNSTPDGGWQEEVYVQYGVSAAEKRKIGALAKKHAGKWYCILFDAPNNALNKRVAQFGLIITTFKAPGLAPESFAGKTAYALDSVRLSQFKDFIEQARIECAIPGVAVALVQDNKVVFEQGFGVRSLTTKEPVTPHTRFIIGSTTKALTTYMIARLIDHGLFTWDTRVTDLMPSFALGDPELTKRLTIQDMVGAKSGIPSQGIEFFFNAAHATPESRIAFMQTMKPTTAYGQAFQYSNALVAAAGFIAAHAVYPTLSLGQAYDMAMQQYVFEPLGMHESTFDYARVRTGDYAVPYMINVLQALEPLVDEQETWISAERPAGGLWSSVHDMALYLLAELNGTTSVNIRKRWEPSATLSDTAHYGLCLMNETKIGITQLGHGGATMGFSTQMFFLPGVNVGMIVLCNVQNNDVLVFQHALERKLFELLFDARNIAHKQLHESIANSKQMITSIFKTKQIAAEPVDSLVKQYLGTYTHDVLGTVTICQDGARVLFDAGEWTVPLGQQIEPDGTTYLIGLNGILSWRVLRPIRTESNVVQEFSFDSGQHTYVFKRIRV